MASLHANPSQAVQVDVPAIDDVRITLPPGGSFVLTDGESAIFSDVSASGEINAVGLEFPVANLPDLPIQSVSLRLYVSLFESTNDGLGNVEFPVILPIVGSGGFDGEFTITDVFAFVSFDPVTVDDIGVLDIPLPLDTPVNFPGGPSGDTFGSFLERAFELEETVNDPGLAFTLDLPVAIPAELTWGLLTTEGAASPIGDQIPPTLRLTFVPEPTSLLIFLPALGLSIGRRYRRL
ncbi:MAG: hypothetical protein AAGI68_16895 [Planctomycetota bacterium]